VQPRILESPASGRWTDAVKDAHTVRLTLTLAGAPRMALNSQRGHAPLKALPDMSSVRFSCVPGRPLPARLLAWGVKTPRSSRPLTSVRGPAGH